MPVDERTLPVADLQPGMWVSRLDRDWLGTPFPMQGFLVKDQEDIRRLAEFCREVVIDVSPERRQEARRPLMSLEGSRVGGVPLRKVLPYPVRHEVRAELDGARKAKTDMLALAKDLEADLKAGRPIELDRVQASVEGLVASVLRNPDAIFWLLGLVRRDHYAHHHALQCSALAAAFGRHLAMPRDMILDLATGGFLLDAGMSKVPPELLTHPGPLDEEQRGRVRAHVETGLRILHHAGLMRPAITEMIAGHHERHDGSGYPRGLVGEDIPLAARIAGLVDSYDAMINDRPYRAALAPHAALQALYRERETLFQEEVVEHLLQCLGVYPTGSLVELSNGEVAVVMAQNPARRLKPRVMVLMSPDKRLYQRFVDIDLMQVDNDASGRPGLMISAALPAGAHGLDQADLFLGQD